MGSPFAFLDFLVLLNKTGFRIVYNTLNTSSLPSS